MLESVTSAALASALDGLAARQRAIANNIANVNTPGYTAERVSFESALAASVAEHDGHVGDDATVRRPHDEIPGLSARHAGLRQLRRHLGLGCLELRLGALEGRLARVILLEELLLAFELLDRDFEGGTRGLHLRVALVCTGWLGAAAVQAAG